MFHVKHFCPIAAQRRRQDFAGAEVRTASISEWLKAWAEACVRASTLFCERGLGRSGAGIGLTKIYHFERQHDWTGRRRMKIA